MMQPAKWHKATCHHKWCNCSDAGSHDRFGPCKHCRRKTTNLRLADPTVRHPEGLRSEDHT